MKKKKHVLSGVTAPLKVMQHLCIGCAAAILAITILGSYVTVTTRNGEDTYSFKIGEKKGEFNQSSVYNAMLGKNMTDLICYGAIRAQMETDSTFDGEKEIDITAFANRYQGLDPEYMTVNYRLSDLIKWAQAGVEEETVHMTSEEAKSFLGTTRTITEITQKETDRNGYYNSDYKKTTRTEDVSANMLNTDTQTTDEDVEVTIIKNRYLSVDGKKLEEYATNWSEYYRLAANLERTARDLLTNYNEYLSYQEYYDIKKNSVKYCILRTIGNKTQVFSNVSSKGTTAKVLTSQFMDSYESYLIYDSENMTFDTNSQIEEETFRYVLNGYEYAYPADTRIYIGVEKPYVSGGAYDQALKSYDSYAPYLIESLIASGVLLLIAGILIFAITCLEGRKWDPETESVIYVLKKEDHIPTELMAVLGVVMTGVALYAMFEYVESYTFFRELLGKQLYAGVAGLAAVIGSMVISFFYYSLIRRIKAHSLWRDSLLQKGIQLFIRLFKYLSINGNMVARVFVPGAVLAILNLLPAFARSSRGVHVLYVLFLILVDAAAIFVYYRSVSDRRNILSVIRRINEGKLDKKVETKGLFGENQVLAGEVNAIGDSISNAVAISMKDERLKADLITNVSHDLKTPLTSIINYVDLIKRENVENEKVKEYISVLDSKSQRLKQLTDDLVEASKISSGNIVLQLERINLTELINQSLGEFSDKFEQKQLSPMIRAAEGNMLIRADSRRIWRVIENLFNNIFKYAMPGTRVYIDMEKLEGEQGAKVALSIKNISANPIQVDTEELTERFIRGEESRTTEGSGLGLSIAKNLTTAMGGEFHISIDGDLFKVTLIFPELQGE